MVGLSIAYQLIERNIAKKIIIIEKEKKIGLHSSGRNSGVLHAGLYYKPNSLKAKVSVEGSSRLKEFIKEKGIKLLSCGKVIVAQKLELDSQLDLLAKRGRENGAKVELWDEKQLHDFIPEARSASGRALWSPNTAVVKPISVLNHLLEDVQGKGVILIKSAKDWNFSKTSKCLLLGDSSKISYGHLINCAGLQADRIAHKFEVGMNFKIMPFKGIYWQLKKDSPIKIKTNLYPVPDLNIPFLGVHFTPSVDDEPVISIGPTATPALGRENYTGLTGIEPIMALSNFSTLFTQYISNISGFRKYVHEQSFLAIKPFLLKSAQELIPSIESKHIEISKKVGIRSQLFNTETRELVDDFLCLSGLESTHVLNAISPAFTASFSLADIIIDQVIKK